MVVSTIKKIAARLMDILFVGCCLAVVLFLAQLFCFTSFKIPSDSMEPALKDGDQILVNKMIKGARLFDVFSALENKEVPVHRMPGMGNFNRNDILVFNFPYQSDRWDSIRMDVMQYYVKRCIALPGDTLEIKDGFYKVRGCDERLGNYQAQEYLAGLRHPVEQGIVIATFPFDEQLGWTIRNFGPLPIPQENQEIMIDKINFRLYRQLINWEQKKKLNEKDGKFLLGDSLIYRYRFTKNYYFVSGDNMPNSQDSRYWGMLPEDYIVGKAVRIWSSKDRNTDKIRWERVMKEIV